MTPPRSDEESAEAIYRAMTIEALQDLKDLFTRDWEDARRRKDPDAETDHAVRLRIVNREIARRTPPPSDPWACDRGATFYVRVGDSGLLHECWGKTPREAILDVLSNRAEIHDGMNVWMWRTDNPRTDVFVAQACGARGPCGAARVFTLRIGLEEIGHAE